MTMLTDNSYGKTDVRLMKVNRGPERDEIVEMTVDIQLWGDLEEGYTAGDNTKVLPTDTMKNTVYAMARKHPVKTPEQFGQILAEHFVSTQPQIHRSRIEIVQRPWEHLPVDGAPHPHVFTGNSGERRTAEVLHTDEETTVRSGIRDLMLLKSSDSGFENFVEDEFTTLEETNDRVLATRLEAHWLHTDPTVDFASHHSGVRQTLTETFANHDSLSVQHTLYAMGEAVLEQFDDVAGIYVSMPNVHNIPVDLEPFGLDNPHEILKPIDAPSGYIDATLTRG